MTTKGCELSHFAQLLTANREDPNPVRYLSFVLYKNNLGMQIHKENFFFHCLYEQKRGATREEVGRS